MMDIFKDIVNIEIKFKEISCFNFVLQIFFSMIVGNKIEKVDLNEDR